MLINISLTDPLSEAIFVHLQFEILNEGDLAPAIIASADSEKSHQKFINKYELPFSLISDVEKIIGKVITKEHNQQIFTELSH